MKGSLVPHSLVIATDIDVLPVTRQVSRAADHLVVRCPSNPLHWWGNFLVFDDPPGPGDGPRWEAAFTTAFADLPEVRHRAFTWDRGDGAEGALAAEFTTRAYRVERTIGLTAAPADLHPHPRANSAIEIRALSPAPGADEPLWSATLALQIAVDDAAEIPTADYAPYARRRLAELRALSAAGRGAWYVALDPADEALLAACGVIATDGRGRFQSVITAAAHRGRGIASRLVVEAAADAATRHDLTTLVIAADVDYHALGIYESLGFARADRVCSAMLAPGSHGSETRSSR